MGLKKKHNQFKVLSKIETCCNCGAEKRLGAIGCCGESKFETLYQIKTNDELPYYATDSQIETLVSEGYIQL